MPCAQILVVEDEPAIVEVLRYNLERADMQVQVLERGEQVLPTVARQRPDLILLDLMLPGLDGLELTRLLKRDPATAEIPIIMLTARAEEVDRVVGFELGADDYVTKPFSPRELLLRVKAVLRRFQLGRGDAELLTAGPIKVDPDGFRAWLGDEELTLTATEFRLLRLLVERRGRVQSRTSLLQEVWGYSEDVDSRTVDTHVGRLRHKLGQLGAQIETVIGVGYRLNAP